MVIAVGLFLGAQRLDPRTPTPQEATANRPQNLEAKEQQPKAAETPPSKRAEPAAPKTKPAPSIVQQGRNNIAQVGIGNQATITEIPLMRHLSEEQQRAIESVLVSIPPDVKIDLKTLMSDEAQQYAQQFNTLLTKNKRRTFAHVAVGAGWPILPVGVLVISHSDADSASGYRDALVRRMIDTGMDAQAANGPWVDSGNLFIVVGLRREEVRRQ